MQFKLGTSEYLAMTCDISCTIVLIYVFPSKRSVVGAVSVCRQVGSCIHFFFLKYCEVLDYGSSL
jgi:hypothetical protein